MMLLYHGQPHSEIDEMPVSDVMRFVDILPELARAAEGAKFHE
jgi:hypothetical protein